MRNPPTDRQTLVATALWATAVIAALALHPPARIATLAVLFLGPLAWAVWRFPWRSDPSTVTLPRGFILPRGWRLAIDPTYYEPTWRAVLYHGLMWTLMACVVGPFIVGPLSSPWKKSGRRSDAFRRIGDERLSRREPPAAN